MVSEKELAVTQNLGSRSGAYDLTCTLEIAMRVLVDKMVLPVLKVIFKNEFQIVRGLFCIGTYWPLLLCVLQTWTVPMYLFGVTSPFFAIANLIILVWRMRLTDAVITFFSWIGFGLNYVLLSEMANP